LNEFKGAEMKALVLITAATIAATSSFALAQGGGAGAAGSSAANAGVSNSNNAGPGSQNSTVINPGGNGGVTPSQNARTGTNTQPSNSPNTVGAPGVGVGHTATGQPIGTPGSGPGSPDQPVDSGSSPIKRIIPEN
jgi:hypothetical protein